MSVTVRRTGWSLLYTLVGFLIGANPTHALSVGDSAPSLHTADWLSGTSDSLSIHSGTPLVIEFWATWCAPCRLSIPHLNRIAAALPDEDVTFVAITSESPATATTFTLKTPVNAVVGCDTSRALHTAFGVGAVPRAFLVNANGIICWSGHPMSLTEEIVRNFIRTGTCPPVHTGSPANELKPIPILASSIYSLTFNHSSVDLEMRSTAPLMSQRTIAGRYEAEFRSQTISAILCALLDITQPHIQLVLAPEDEPVLDASLYVAQPLNTSTGRLEAVNTICRAFGLQMQRKAVRLSGWNLSCSDRSRLVPTPAENSGTYSQYGIWSGSGMKMDDLATSMESLFGQVFFSNSSIDGVYDFEIPSSGIGHALAVLRDRYGIIAEQAERETEVYVFSQAVDAK